MTFMHNFKASFHIVLHTKTYTNNPTEHDTQTLVKEVLPLERERERQRYAKMQRKSLKDGFT